MDIYQSPEMTTLQLILISVVISMAAAMIYGAAYTWWNRGEESGRIRFLKNTKILLGYGLPVSFVAFGSGYMAGMSRTGVIGNLVPAIVSLLGASLIYVFGSDAKYRNIVAYCIVLFAFCVLYGTQYGAYTRTMEQGARLTALMAVERRLATMRVNLGLEKDFPSWLVGAEPK